MKTLFSLFIIFMCLLVMGCVVIEEVNDPIDLQEINPLGLPMSVYRDATESERAAIIEKVSAIPMDEVVSYLEEMLEDYANNHELLELISIEIDKNDLLMHENKNQRVFENLVINAELSLLTKGKGMTLEEREDIASRIREDIRSLFYEDTYLFLKLNSYSIYIIDNNTTQNFGPIGRVNRSDPTIYTNQTAEELETQDIVYNFLHEHNLSLRFFGTIEETKELYIGIPLYDHLVFDEFNENEEEFTENLNMISDSLYNKIISNTISKQYLQSNNADIITIVYRLTWTKDETIRFTYDL